MKCTILGSGTSMGVPVAGGFYKRELVADSRNMRSRCSAWIQQDGFSLVIDVGPEFRLQSISAGITQIDAVLITHEHMDHVAGIDDLRMYNYIQKDSIPLYTTPSAIESIKSRFHYLFGAGRYPGSTRVQLHAIHDPIQVGPFAITAIPAKHGELDIIGFKINDLCYLTDVKEIPEESKSLLKDVQVIILSALRWEPEHPTHLSIPDAVDLISELGIPEAYLIHMNGQTKHGPSNKRLPDHVKLAYDQQTIYL
ncbi:MAG: MBL fold metallo-hydrolase [Rhodothermaeota bacterium MED-G12]|nr:MAG: MBL fold metallo-hydrolase [Rhodothermaeota bacterium MED-G12]